MKKLLSAIALFFICSVAFSQISLTENHTAPTCYGYGNGTATITATGGTAPYSYTLSVTQNTTGIFTGLASGTQTVVVEDAASLTATIALTIPVTPQIIPTVTSIPALCFGTATGTINVTNVSGGNAPFQYELNGGAYQGASTFSNVPSGVLLVGVKDANGCIGTQTVQVTQPTQLNSSVSASPSCNGVCSSTANVNSFGGTAPYQYSWSDGSTTSQVPNLCAGTYTVQTLDANNCTVQNSVTVISYSINLAVTSTSVLCNGTPTGTINITSVIGGNPAYVYNLNGGSYSASPVFPNVFAGIYTAGVRDIGGCIGTQTVLVTEPTPLTATTTATDSNCGQSNGAVCAIVSGGTSPYNYLWSFGSTTLCGNNIPAGAYTFTVIDTNACMTVLTGLVNNISGPLASIASSTNATCGQPDGALCAITTGGIPPYNYSWSNGASTLCNTNIPVGVYSFSVTDAAGCIATIAGQVNNIAGPIISITSQTNVTCFGLCDGSAITSITAGTGPFIYSWSNGSSIPNATNLCAGLYSVSVTDFSGCIGTASVNITQPTALNVFVNPNNPSCFGQCNGSASAAAFGGTPPYTYAWTGGAGNIPTTNSLCAGNYGVSIIDNNGCVATSSVMILNPPTLTAIITKTNVTCGGNCNGQASANVTGGSGAFTFLWLPTLQTGNTANGLCAGQYSLNVTDQNGCITTETFVIANQGANAITNATLTTSVINETCLFTNDGGIDLTITGSNSGPFTYQWSNGAITQDITNIPTGAYNVTVFDASLNCLSISSNVSANGTNCGTISGNVFIDNNSDCIKNAGDNNSNNTQIIANPGNRIGYTNSNGDYVFYNLPFATYTITSSTTANMLATCVTTLNTTLNSGTPNSINNNFAKEYLPITQPDIYVSAWSQGIVPGFVCRVNYLVYNYNTFNANGIFKATLPSAFIPNITNAFPAAYTLSGDTIIWNFANISYTGWSPNFYVDFTTPLTVPLGSIFSTCMWAQPTVTDLNYVNNNYCYSRYVTGSFDPNDKTVSPLGIGANGDISATETDLTYLIRFQNTGNGPAVNIVVKDTLSPNVDINTFEMLGASHNYNIDILQGNVLRWKFNNIMLADSGSNEPSSHGYIQYRIKRTNNNTPGTQIKNTAYIYFDFNEPVVTNTAINTIETITGIKSSTSTNDEWNVYPNPSTGILYIINSSLVKDQSQIQVINSIGQTVLEETITSNYKNVDLSKLNNGVYFVKIVSDKQSVIQRVVLSR